MKAIALGSLLLASSFSMAADYKIDEAHSSVVFQIGHLGVSTTIGRFDEFEGTFSMDEGLQNVTTEVTVKTDSVNTNHEARDKHLRSPDFLDVKQFPHMSFKSTSFKNNVLTGDLTLHGQTKTVAFDVEQVGEGKDPWGGYRAGFTATSKIKRSDFGVTYFIPGVTDDTEIQIFIEGIRL